jgi:anti-sigma B factor antagonist
MEEQAGDVVGVGDDAGAHSMSIVCHREGTSAEVQLRGDLDLAGGDAVEATVDDLVTNGVTDVTVRADGVTFMDSSGLGGLLAARAMVVDADGDFRFGPTTDRVARVIDLAGVDDLLGPAPS